MRAFLLVSLAFLSFAAPALAGDKPTSANVGGVISFEHSLIVYLFAILISFGVAVMIRLVSSLLRKMQLTAAE